MATAASREIRIRFSGDGVDIMGSVPWPSRRLWAALSSVWQKSGVPFVLLLSVRLFRAPATTGNALRGRWASMQLRGAEQELRLRHRLAEAELCPSRRTHPNSANRFPPLSSTR